MTPVQKYFKTKSLKLSYYEWGDPKDPTILLIHATGMHGRIWDQTIKALPAGYHIIALDQRGHGASVDDKYLLDWSMMGNDAIEFVQGLELGKVIGVGHSMGGHVLTQVALALPTVFQCLLLIDPVIFPPAKYGEVTDFEKGTPVGHPLARRHNQFDNWQHMRDIFAKKEPYSLWQSDVLDDYCQYGLVENSDNTGYSLACAPAVEASVYMGHLSINLSKSLSKLTLPVTVMRAKQKDPNHKHQIDFSASPTWKQLAGEFEKGQDVWLENLTHFIPMQDPELTARHILELVNKG